VHPFGFPFGAGQEGVHDSHAHDLLGHCPVACRHGDALGSFAPATRTTAWATSAVRNGCGVSTRGDRSIRQRARYLGGTSQRSVGADRLGAEDDPTGLDTRVVASPGAISDREPLAVRHWRRRRTSLSS
jgi:hypothetical protein